ncbi:uncharacterized protein HMPREF1120_00807 [Exophiala dermatitidis NIH/UT8656]|uniref:Uncharacterized protein n=1 Tax=Exophiala dermatitidis (strain ATCC 34100 / CBS 525.76 / NIH/UT8656) TaxID=858893 RepID=H6BKG3_EXODN|nr:uncharacterized protein HMPREF1120_00807 [Exophiala dermatitidis NIH/UT8656]EHY52596.1 hypothetical protein HMPREF1120_00807 [Exophiala dermatitidis NIH/UT8656]
MRWVTQHRAQLSVHGHNPQQPAAVCWTLDAQSPMFIGAQVWAHTVIHSASQRPIVGSTTNCAIVPHEHAGHQPAVQQMYSLQSSISPSNPSGLMDDRSIAPLKGSLPGNTRWSAGPNGPLGARMPGTQHWPLGAGR